MQLKEVLVNNVLTCPSGTRYALGETIGRSAQGKVTTAINLATNEECACKIVTKKHLKNYAAVAREANGRVVCVAV